MALADSKSDDLPNAEIDSLIDDAIPRNKKGTAWEICVLKGNVENY